MSTGKMMIGYLNNKPASKAGRFIINFLFVPLMAAGIITADINDASSQIPSAESFSADRKGGGREDILKSLRTMNSGMEIPSANVINTRPEKQLESGGEQGKAPITDRTSPLLTEEIRLSPMETVYNNRLNLEEKIRQFGYNFFKREIWDNFLPVGEGYKVGPGDNVSLYFWGDPVDILGLNGFYKLTVDRDGKIFVPNLGVFYVWGLDIANVKDIIHSSLSKKFKRFEIALTLGQLRQFPVYVSGYVDKPGVVQSLGTYSVMDVIILAGGVAGNGSLRNIEVIRTEGKVTRRIKIDLYDLFIKGDLVNIPVKEGDSILVNMIGKTAAVAGDVKRPAIYEVKDNETISDLINYAGGLTYSAYSASARHFRYENDSIRIHEGALGERGFVSREVVDGDSLLIQSINSNVKNEIIVEGYIKYPGSFQWTEGISLGEILKKAEMLPDTDTGVADIRRKDSASVVSFSPKAVLSGSMDIPLNKRDIITFYPRWLNEPMHISGEVEEARLVPFYTGIKLLDAMKQIKFKKEPSLLKAEIYSVKKKTPETEALESVNLQQIKKTIYLHDLLVRGDAEADILLEPGDKVVIRNIESNEKNKTITLLGEVKNPGVYRYRTGQKLSEIIAEAGGYAENAYPRGMIFTRKNAQKLQMNQINISMMSMEEYVTKSSAGLGAAGGSDDEKAALAMVMKQQEEMLALIKKKSTLTLGRLALEIPLTMEQLKKSDDDIDLVEDDYIFIPAKPNYVLVLGNVFNQISMPHSEGKTVKRYLADVGGPAKSSDLDNMYIIRANGKIISRQNYEKKYGYLVSFFRNFENLELQEGDAVVVPFEITIPIMWRPILRDITQIIFQSISTLVLASSL